MNFTPKTSIDEYIEQSELNSRLYEILLYLQDSRDNNRYKLKRTPLEIFNQAYYICKELQDEKHPEEKALNIWENVKQSFLAYETSVIFSCIYIILSFTSEENPNMKYCLQRIRPKIEHNYFCEFEPLLKEELTYLTAAPMSFEQLKTEADKIQDLDKKELYYTAYQTKHKQARSKGNILQQIADEIELIRRTKELLRSGSTADTIAANDNTNAASIKIRSVIILELLKKMQCGKAQNDLTKICRLIAFLTGNSYEKIYNEAQKGITLANYHKKEIEEANKILADLNASISIEKDRQY